MLSNFLIPLQGLQQFQIKSSPIQGIIFIAGIILIVGLFIFINKSKKVASSSVFKSGAVNIKHDKIKTSSSFERAANSYGLNYAEKKFLQDAFYRANINLDNALSSRNNVDAAFEKLLKYLGREDNAQENIQKMFDARNKIEYYLSAEENSARFDENFVHRRYRRTKASIPSSLYLVTTVIVKKGFQKEKKLQAAKTASPGNIVDISSGGCAVNTNAAVKAGAYLKVEFKLSRQGSAVLAQILRINKNSAGNVLHLRFLKVPARTFNAINILVYNYKE